MNNPYLIEGPALISFSGGRTSAYMLWHILQAHGGTLPENVKVAFANTGMEHPATLNFVQECSERWGVEITWLEYDPNEEHETKIVTHNSASRDGEPLKAAIATRPTPHLFNPMSPYCSGMTKQKRLDRFARYWCGFEKWVSIRGIRADEQKRVESNRKSTSPVVGLPLADAGVTKEHITAFWATQDFDLRLPNEKGVTILGNCVLCPKKYRPNLIRIIKDFPEDARLDWWLAREQEMTERIAGIPRRDPGRPELRNRMLRGGESYSNLARIAEYLRANPQPVQIDMFDGPDDGESVDCACTD